MPLIETCPDRDHDYSAPPAGSQMTAIEHASTASQGPTFPGASNASHDGSDSLAVDIDPCWLPEFPTIWQPTTLDSDASWLDDSTEWNTTNTSGGSGVSESQYGLVAGPGWGILQTPAHLPTTLIEHWFRYICPTWSTFDSEVNYNRQLARSTWPTSEPVFYTMQAMSAACLIDNVPQLGETLPWLRAQATAAIDQGIAQVRGAQPPRVTADLVFAVFALGASLHWNTPALSENPLLESARELLSTWQVELSAADALLHAYFCQALTYWEMLLAAMGRGSIPARIDRKRRQYQDRLRQAMHLPDGNSDAVSDEPLSFDPGQNLNVLGTRPNSWCGVSNEVVDVFGQVLALCRSACHHRKDKNALTLARTSNVLCDISFAHELQRELLSMDFSTLVSMEEAQGFSVQTRDDNTPISHLLQTAEAYRQAALLQLHLAFSDLAMTPRERRCGSIFTDTPPNDTVDDTVENEQSRAEFLLALTLQLVATLEQIPAESGSRSIHPMLYLSAAAGLRFDACPKSSDDDFDMTSMHGAIGLSTDFALKASDLQTNQLSRDTTQPAFSLPGNAYQHTSDSAHFPGSFIPRSTLEVSRARRLVCTRLSSLQQTMPQRGSDSTLQLVKAIWLEYDGVQSGSSSVNWFDILTENGSGTMLW